MKIKITSGASVSYAVSTGVATVAIEFGCHVEFMKNMLMDEVLDLELPCLTCRF
ncbi:hypothetical protein HanPSC8_Chr09g0367821 [Helianthus annuus]|nr:hypothetical protein HanPSC8_Chr09g0367821 [Helianthus annuus]